jgi:outer membrane protein OmpA-like peptidoglycan-associated protein
VLAEDEFFTEPFWVKVKYEPPRKWKLDHVHFDVDKSILRADALPQLSELLDYLQRHASVKVEIAGHTDNTGEESHNQQLSADRANSIRDWLIRKGISAYRLIAKGYGSTQPVADNSTEARRQLNRRTEARVL